MADPVKTIDQLIRTGRTADAKALLRKYQSWKLGPEKARSLASLARRLGFPSMGLKVLGPVVRPSGRKKMHATALDRFEYGACLLCVGAIAEGRELLESPDLAGNPDAIIYRAIACLMSWESAEAIPLLEELIASPKIDDYQRAIARSNLAASLVDRRDPRAADLLKKLLPELKSSNYTLLWLNSMIVEAERWFHLGELDRGEEILGEAREVATQENPRNELLFIDKWLAIISLAREGKSARPSLEEVRVNARKARHWETLRSCDYYEATLLKDPDLFERVYFGTPMASLRRALLEDFGVTAPQSTSYVWCERGKKMQNCIDLNDVHGGLIRGTDLKAGSTGHVLLTVLVSDFYKPFRTAALHAKLFPSEYYNPQSSPRRVHQVILRTRECVAPLGIHIDRIGGGYRIRLSHGVAIRVRRVTDSISPQKNAVESLMGEFAGRGLFTVKEAASVLGVTPWNARKMLKAGIDSGVITRIGAGPETRYEVTQSPRKLSRG